MTKQLLFTFLALGICGASFALDKPADEAARQVASEITASLQALGGNPGTRQISAIVFKAVRTSPDQVLVIVDAASRVTPKAAVPEIVTAAVSAVPNPWKEVVYRTLSTGGGFHPARSGPAPVQSDQHWAIHSQHARTDWRTVTEGENLALHKPVTFSPAPNYAPTTSADDSKKLTDRELVRPGDTGSDARMWQDKHAVGWTGQPHVRMVLDLGGVKPVGSVVIRVQTAMNNTDVTPTAFKLALGDDGKRYFPIRTLAVRTRAKERTSQTFKFLPATDAGVYAFTLDAGFAARYVQIDIESRATLLCDEIAVLRAEEPVPDLGGAPLAQRGQRGTEAQANANSFDVNRITLAEAIARTAFAAQPGLLLPELTAAAEVALRTSPSVLLGNIQNSRAVSGVGDAGVSNYANEPLRTPNQPVVSQ